MVKWKIKRTNSAFKPGGFFRHSDRSIIASTAIKIDQIEFGFSSDFLSRMQVMSKSESAFELSLKYTPAPVTRANLKSDPSRR